MKFSLEANIFCDGDGCDELVTTTAEDQPTIDGMIREARHHGWCVVLDAKDVVTDDGHAIKCYCPKCADRLSFALPTTVLEECRAFVVGFQGDEAQDGIGDLLTRIDQCLQTGDTPRPLYTAPGHCSYCLSKMVADVVPNTGGNTHQARCPKCNSRGPWAKSAEEALRK